MSLTSGGESYKSLVFLILAGALSGCSQPSGFHVVPEHKDLGVADVDSRVAIAEFEVFNGLDVPVEVKNMYPSCTCSNVELLENPIPSGKSTKLRVTANLSKRPGKQDLSVVLVTDNSEFPRKLVSFTVLVPATGNSERSLSIGSFYPNSEINIAFPSSSFTQGTVEPVKDINDDDSLGITTHFAKDHYGDISLVVKGTAPRAVGPFSKTLTFRESFSEESLGEALTELKLLGNVVARWNVTPAFYGGFVSLNKDGRIISLPIERNAAIPCRHCAVHQAAESGLGSVDVPNVSVTFSEEWISLKTQATSSDKVELKCEIHEDKLKQLGAVQTEMELVFEYGDGYAESYSSNLYAHIDP